MEAGSHALIDVRPAKLFGEGHLEGAVNVEYYRPIQGW
jgi:rhodanese-related sulfurtransferase